ncbi:MAG: lysostaphin resistance A-like protein [Candidatus Heimdallarchaeota archaeon]
MVKAQQEESWKHLSAWVLLLETILILVVFNASSYFNTTTYSKSIDTVGVALTALLMFWIWGNSRFRFGYDLTDLGLIASSVSRKQWVGVFAIGTLFYLVAFALEVVFPSEIKGDVTLIRLLVAAVFTFTFGPLFEELLFRGYLFKRSQDALPSSPSSKIAAASLVSGVAFGFWHLPTPLLLLYFHDPIIPVYANLLPFVFFASLLGIFLGEIRHRTRSILPGIFLHFCANSMYVITLVLRLF